MSNKTATAVFCLAFNAGLAAAQSPPGPVDPGQLQRELRRPPSPRVEPPAVRPAAPSDQPTLPAGVPFRVRAVVIEGSTLPLINDLQLDYAALIGKTTQLEDVNQAAARMTARFREAGYILAQVVVPPQDISEGILRIVVYEGYIDEVIYRGDNAPAAIRDYAERIKATRPLTLAALERWLLLVNDIAGITAYGALGPSPRAVGAAEMTLTISSSRVSADAGISNRITNSLGHARIEAGLDLSNLFFSQERFGTRAIASPNGRLLIVNGSWDRAWGSDGLKTGVSLTTVRSKPALDLRQQSTSEALGFTASYPFVRGRSANVVGRWMLSALNSKSEALDIAGPPLFEDRVRATRLGVTADLADDYGGINLVDLEYSLGLDALGARKLGGAVAFSRNGAKNDFQRTTVYLSRLQTVAPRVSLLFAVTAQATSDTLFSSEQFGAGGELFLRAYDGSELIGDRGVAGKVEVRVVPWGNLLAYGFYDYARVSNTDSANAIFTGTKAASTGLGVRLGQGRFAGYVEWAKPLLRDVGAYGNRQARIFGGLKYSF